MAVPDRCEGVSRSRRAPQTNLDRDQGLSGVDRDEIHLPKDGAVPSGKDSPVVRGEPFGDGLLCRTPRIVARIGHSSGVVRLEDALVDQRQVVELQVQRQLHPGQ